jgi:hypothetical protein
MIFSIYCTSAEIRRPDPELLSISGATFAPLLPVYLTISTALFHIVSLRSLRYLANPKRFSESVLKWLDIIE